MMEIRVITAMTVSGFEKKVNEYIEGLRQQGIRDIDIQYGPINSVHSAMIVIKDQM